VKRRAPTPAAPPDRATLGRLRALLARPTAPYRETAVRAWVTDRLAAAGVPWCEDQDGNLVVGADSLAAYRRALARRDDGAAVVLVAHMDHPGFHGTRWLDAQRLAVRWHGGGPVRHLDGARVWLSVDGRREWPGVMRAPRPARHGHGLERAEVELVEPLRPRPAARRLFGGLAFRAPTWRSGHRLYTRVADDLTGVFAIVETAIAARRRRAGAPALFGLLTRAEEVGFVGMLAHLDAGWLQRARRPLLCVSLEASRHGPGARLGAGPVIRLGDRQGPFAPDDSRRLALLAARVLGDHHQQRLMDGGSCEASAMLAHGLPAAGLALPLGNYHNQNLDGGQDADAAHGPAPEFVDLRDLAGLLRLCRGLAQQRWIDDPWASARGRLTQRLRGARGLLATR
jgi:endoglucanase